MELAVVATRSGESSQAAGSSGNSSSGSATPVDKRPQGVYKYTLHCCTDKWNLDAMMARAAPTINLLKFQLGPLSYIVYRGLKIIKWCCCVDESCNNLFPNYFYRVS